MSVIRVGNAELRHIDLVFFPFEGKKIKIFGFFSFLGKRKT